MAKDVSPGTRRIMDRAWMRDSVGTVYYGESLLLAMLMQVKKSKNRTSEDEDALREIISKNKKARG